MIYSVYKPHTHAASNSSTCTWDANISSWCSWDGDIHASQKYPFTMEHIEHTPCSLLMAQRPRLSGWPVLRGYGWLNRAEHLRELLTLLFFWSLPGGFGKTMPTSQPCYVLCWCGPRVMLGTFPGLPGDSGMARIQDPWTIALYVTVLDFKRLELYFQTCHHPSTVSVSPLKAVDKCIWIFRE